MNKKAKHTWKFQVGIENLISGQDEQNPVNYNVFQSAAVFSHFVSPGHSCYEKPMV